MSLPERISPSRIERLISTTLYQYSSAILEQLNRAYNGLTQRGMTKRDLLEIGEKVAPAELDENNPAYFCGLLLKLNTNITIQFPLTGAARGATDPSEIKVQYAAGFSEVWALHTLSQLAGKMENYRTRRERMYKTEL